MNWKPILAVVALLIALGVIAELFVPGSGRFIDIGAGVFAVATWVVPRLRFALAKKRRTSLAAVGFTIHIFVLAACLSAVGLLLAVLTLVFAQSANWAWLAILAIVAFWLTVGVVVSIGSNRSPPAGANKTD